MPATSAERTASPRMREKSPDAFRTISEVSQILDTPAHVLRFWESKFSQIKPIKRGGGRRYYRPQDINLLRGIRDLLYADGMTIKGVQKILREQGTRRVAERGAERDAEAGSEAGAGAAPKGATVITPAMAVAKAAPAPASAPASPPEQGDLFAAAPRRPVLRATDRDALKSVLTKLEALRDTMKAHGA